MFRPRLIRSDTTATLIHDVRIERSRVLTAVVRAATVACRLVGRQTKVKPPPPAGGVGFEHDRLLRALLIAHMRGRAPVLLPRVLQLVCVILQ